MSCTPPLVDFAVQTEHGPTLHQKLVWVTPEGQLQLRDAYYHIASVVRQNLPYLTCFQYDWHDRHLWVLEALAFEE